MTCVKGKISGKIKIRQPDRLIIAESGCMPGTFVVHGGGHREGPVFGLPGNMMG